MKNATQKLKAIILAAMLCSSILLADLPNVHAQNDSFDLKQEISEKRAAGITVYELYTDNGEIMGYFEPFTDANIMAMTTYAITYTWNHDISADSIAIAKGSHSFLAGDSIIVNISQNPSGAGYLSRLGLYDRDNNTYAFSTDSTTTNGWNGALTVGYNGHFSFAIENLSNVTIHYEGYYAF